MTLLWSSVQFFLSCCVCLSFTQIVAALILFPPLFTVGHVLWFVCLVLPILGVTLMGTPTDQDVMKKPLGKNQIVFNFEVCLQKTFLKTLYKTIFLLGANICFVVLRFEVSSRFTNNFNFILWNSI